MAFLIRALTWAEARVFGEMVEIKGDDLGAEDTPWDPPPPDALATSRNFPAARICPRLTLVRDGTKALVREFWYKPDAGPADASLTYERPENEDGWCYAVLLSKDSNYIDVGYVVLAVAISFSSLLTQLQLALNCIRHRSNSAAPHSLLFWFPSIFLAKVVALLATALARARRKIRKDPGDLRGDVWQCAKRIRLACLVLFNVFDVPGTVADIVSVAHTAKPFQPYAVFRKGGSRFWIVGFYTWSHFQVEMEFSSMPNLQVSIIFGMPLVLMQFFLVHDAKLSVSLLMTMFTSLLKLVYSIYKAYRLRRHRKKYRDYHRREIEEQEERRRSGADPATISSIEGQLRSLYRDLTYHFGDPYPRNLLPPCPAGQGGPLLPPAS